MLVLVLPINLSHKFSSILKIQAYNLTYNPVFQDYYIMIHPLKVLLIE